jgi:hypothetical protein
MHVQQVGTDDFVKKGDLALVFLATSESSIALAIVTSPKANVRRKAISSSALVG